MSTNLENQITQAAVSAIERAIVGELAGYNKPLSNLVQEVCESRANDLRVLVQGAFDDLIDSETFRAELDQALHRKLARTIVGRMGGALEGRVNEMMSNPETRAKIITAIGHVLEKT